MCAGDGDDDTIDAHDMPSHLTHHHHARKTQRKQPHPRTLEVPGLVAHDDEADVVGVDVHRVVPRHGQPHLELARQVPVAVEGLHLVVG